MTIIQRNFVYNWDKMCPVTSTKWGWRNIWSSNIHERYRIIKIPWVVNVKQEVAMQITYYYKVSLFFQSNPRTPWCTFLTLTTAQKSDSCVRSLSLLNHTRIKKGGKLMNVLRVALHPNKPNKEKGKKEVRRWVQQWALHHIWNSYSFAVSVYAWNPGRDEGSTRQRPNDYTVCCIHPRLLFQRV